MQNSFLGNRPISRQSLIFGTKLSNRNTDKKGIVTSLLNAYDKRNLMTIVSANKQNQGLFIFIPIAIATAHTSV